MAVIFRTLDTFDTEFSADSVEWCPVQPFQDILVCGTYEFAKNEEKALNSQNKKTNRLGRIYMFRMNDSGKLLMLQQINTPAVLDMKWMHVANGGKILLAIVNSMGYLQIYQLKNQENVMLELVTEEKISSDNNEEIIALSLDWSTGRYVDDAGDISDPRIVVSDSQGCVSQFTLHENNLSKDLSWRVHEFEAWIAAFDYWQTHSFYTGGDDCKFQLFDARAGPYPIAYSTEHNAGVTSIHSNAEKEFIIATGSYDEVLRLWDRRSLRGSISETNLSGGIWRLKWDPFSHRYLLAACMYGGFQIIDCRNEGTPVIIGEYKEHKSISYGGDWSFLRKERFSDLNASNYEEKIGALIGTCSFYDHAFKLSATYSEDDGWPDS